MTKIAVYGTLRRGFGNYNWLLLEQEFLGEQTISLPFKMISLGGFPGLIRSKENHDSVIEVFEIDEETFRSADSLEGYPHFYNRKLIDTEFGQAWIYYLADGYYDQTRAAVPNGDWKQFIEKSRNKNHEILSQD